MHSLENYTNENRFKEILLVDDEKGIRKVLKISLMDLGYTVFTAENGEEALKSFMEKAPMIVLTDIKMPGMSGIELLKKIKSLNKEVKVIMITGHGDMDLAIESLKYDATDFITKPIYDEVLEVALKRAEERLILEMKVKEYTENLEKLVEEKTRRLIEKERFAAVGETVQGLSHTIKNIAGGLGGGAFVVEKGIELENQEYLKDGWQMVKRNLQRVQSLSLDLLNFNKSQTLNLQKTDPYQVLNDVFIFMKQRADEDQITLKIKPKKGQIFFQMDPELMNHALVNLVSNAMDACLSCEREKERKIVLSCEYSDMNDLIYHVIDHCKGMPASVAENIFEPFFTTKQKEGFGIGLMLTKKIIDQHGGTICVDTKEEAGTHISIHLPRR